MGKNVKNGFSLVELMLAIVIVAIIVVTMTAFLKNSLLLRGDSKLSELAYMCGKDKLSELSVMINPANSSDTVTYDNVKFIRSWNTLPPDSNTLITAVNVTVQYTVSGRTKTVKCSGALN